MSHRDQDRRAASHDARATAASSDTYIVKRRGAALLNRGTGSRVRHGRGIVRWPATNRVGPRDATPVMARRATTTLDVSRLHSVTPKCSKTAISGAPR